MAPGAPRLLKTTLPWPEQRFGNAKPRNRKSDNRSFLVLVISVLYILHLRWGGYGLARPRESDEPDIRLVPRHPMVRCRVAIVAPSVVNVAVIRKSPVVIAHVAGKAPIEPTRLAEQDIVIIKWRIDRVVFAGV